MSGALLQLLKQTKKAIKTGEEIKPEDAFSVKVPGGRICFDADGDEFRVHEFHRNHRHTDKPCPKCSEGKLTYLESIDVANRWRVRRKCRNSECGFNETIVMLFHNTESLVDEVLAN